MQGNAKEINNNIISGKISVSETVVSIRSSQRLQALTDHGHIQYKNVCGLIRTDFDWFWLPREICLIQRTFNKTSFTDTNW